MKQQKLLRFLERASSAANEASNFAAAVEVVLREVGELTGWSVGHAFVRPEGASELESTDTWYLVDPDRFAPFRAATERIRFGFGVSLPGQALTLGKVVWVDDLSGYSESPRKAVASQVGLKSGFAFPVLVRHEVVGVLEFFASEVVERDPTMLEVMSHIGAQLGRVVERERAARRLRHSEQLLAETQRLTRMGSWEWDVADNRVTWSGELYRIFGMTHEELDPTYEGYLSHVHPEDRKMVADAVALAHERHEAFSLDHRILRGSDGELRWVHSRGFALIGPGGEVRKIVGSAQDITEAKIAEERRAETEERLRVLQRHAPIGLALIGLDGGFLQVNPALCDLLARTEEELLGLRFHDVTHPEDIEIGEDLLAGLLAGEIESYQLEKRYLRPDGEVVWAHLSGSIVRDPSGALLNLVSTMQDITERRHTREALRQANKQLQQLALTDTLTGLPNRTMFTDRLHHELDVAERKAQEVALLFIDLDRFKEVNDSFGHAAGDELLVEVARRLAAQARASDTVARFGGDEFAVVLAGPTSPEKAAGVAERMINALRRPFTISGIEMQPSCSIGVACWPEDCGSADQLVQHADVAMYRAKAAGGNRFEMFQPAMTAAAHERARLQQDLRSAIERGDFFVRYQPRMDLATGDMVAVQALVRWAHPDHGEVTAEEFIALAGETGLIGAVGSFVLHEACRQLVEWSDDLPGAAALQVAVNVAPGQLDDGGFLALVHETLAATGLGPGRLVLEITEGMIVAEAGPALDAIGALREMGVNVVLDAFGTEYMSLSHLRRLPIDGVKLHRSFVAGLGNGDKGTAGGDAQMVKAVIAMAHALGFEVVAEWIETGGQLAALRSFGCEQGQGTFWALPLLPGEVAGWLCPAGFAQLPASGDRCRRSWLIGEALG